MTTDLKQIIKLQQEWSERAFGKDRDHVGPLNHLAEEIDEILDNPNDPFEYADAFMLMLDAIWRSPIEFEEFFRALENKMEVNRNREWHPPDENGIWRHKE